jgi:uncharacterized membrane protein
VAALSSESQHSSAADGDSMVVAACCVALATLTPVTLYQTGVIAQLPDPPMRVFDSERITTSKTAHPLGIPDGLLGLASFGGTLVLALLARRHKTARQLLGIKLTLDGSVAAFNAGRQIVEFRKLCSWCTGTALAAGVMAYAGRHTIADSWEEAASRARGAIAATDPSGQ